MKPIEFSLIFFLFLLLFICGCTSDPAKGGFFDGLYGISSGKYEERQNEKQDELGKIEKNNVELDEENVALKEKHQGLEQLRQTYAADLKKLEKDLNQMEIDLNRAQVQGESGLKQKRKLEQELADLKKKLEQEKKFAGESLVSIVNRAIIGLKGRSLEVPVEKQQERELEQKPIHDLIREMDQNGRDEWQISKTLNDKGYPTFDDKDKWYPSTIRNLLNQFKSGA